MQNITIVGNVGTEPQTETIAGSNVTKISVAVNRKEKQESITTWYKCNLWGNLSNIASSYLKKGDKVAISGEMRIREYTNKEGVKATSVEIQVSNITLLGGGSNGSNGSIENEKKTEVSVLNDNQNSEDLPF